MTHLIPGRQAFMGHSAFIHHHAPGERAALMKTFLAVCLLGGALQAAKCQEGWTNSRVISGTEFQRYPLRVFGNTSLQLTPLIQWWNQATSARAVDVDGHAYTNQLPRRPLTAWFRITGDYVQDAYAGWQINATVEDYPGHSRQAVIILGHPPTMAMRYPISQRQKIQAEIDRLSAYARQEDSVEAKEYKESTNQLIGYLNAYGITMINGIPLQPASNTGAALPVPAMTTAAKQRDDAESRIARLQAQLSQLPVIDEHRLDFFAAKVGYVTGTHFEAFDFGDLPFGGAP
jgi:hypothetical protein